MAIAQWNDRRTAFKRFTRKRSQVQDLHRPPSIGRHLAAIYTDYSRSDQDVGMVGVPIDAVARSNRSGHDQAFTDPQCLFRSSSRSVSRSSCLELSPIP